MSYTPPSADNIQFGFIEDGYTPPSADNINFVFEPKDVDRTVTAPIAVARSRNKEGVSLGINIPGVTALARAYYSGIGDSLVLVSNTSLARTRLKTFVNLALSPIVAPIALAKAYATGLGEPPSILQGIGALAKSRAYAWFEPYTNNTSWDDRRPCAVTFDGMTGFDMGPDDWWDTESSLYARPWKVKAYGGNTWIARAKEDWSGWDLDWYREWFQLPEEAGEGCEFDLTFDQNARPFVCWEKDGKIWIYYYDPTEEEMRTRELCDGRTPRAKLDVRRDRLSGESDIILFYINDEAERVEYRLQRDRYEEAYATDLVSAEFNSRDIHDLGGDNEGTDEAEEEGSPTDNDEYYTFDGSDDGLSWDTYYDLTENAAIRIRFKAHNKDNNQCLWSSGGVAVGFDSDGKLGIFDGTNSITVAAEDVPEDEWVEVECSGAHVKLFKSDTLELLSEATGSVDMEHVGTYEVEEDDGQGGTTTSTYNAAESIAFCEDYSPIRDTESTGDYFDGDIDWVKIGIMTTRYDVPNIFLELLYMSSNLRLYLFFSEYDSNAKTYSVGYWHSAPYPYVMEDEYISVAGDSILSAVLKTEFLFKIAEDFSIELDGDDILSAVIRSAIYEYELSDEEVIIDSDSVLEGIIRKAILEAELEDEEVTIDGDSVLSASRALKILEDDIEDEEIGMDGDSILSATITSGS